MPYLDTMSSGQSTRRERDQDDTDREFRHDKYGYYCRYCGGGEHDSKNDLARHEAVCLKNLKGR